MHLMKQSGTDDEGERRIELETRLREGAGGPSDVIVRAGLTLVERDVLDEIVDLLGGEGPSEVLFGDEVLVSGERSESFQDLGLGVRIGGLGADKVGEGFESNASVGANLSDDAIELSIGIVFSDGLQRRLELKTVEETGSVLVEVFEDFLEFSELFGADAGVGLAQDFLLDQGLLVGDDLDELFVGDFEDREGYIGVRIGVDTGGIELLSQLFNLMQLRLGGGDDGASGLDNAQLVLERAGSGRVDSGRLFLDERAKDFGLVGELHAQALVVLLAGQLLGEGISSRIQIGQVGVPS
jgi:hypothetical protein